MSIMHSLILVEDRPRWSLPIPPAIMPHSVEQEKIMSREKLKEIADQLVGHCRNGTEEKGLKELYAKDVESIEAITMPGSDSPKTTGVDGIRGKHEWWNNTFEVHSSEVEGPFLHGEDRFSVIFNIDATNKESSERMSMKEVAVYTVSNGKIIREELLLAEQPKALQQSFEQLDFAMHRR